MNRSKYTQMNPINSKKSKGLSHRASLVLTMATLWLLLALVHSALAVPWWEARSGKEGRTEDTKSS